MGTEMDEAPYLSSRKKFVKEISLAVQWLKFHLPQQGAWV